MVEDLPLDTFLLIMLPNYEVLNILCSGDYFGEVSIIKNTKCHETIFTTCETHFLTFTSNAFKKYLSRHF